MSTESIERELKATLAPFTKASTKLAWYQVATSLVPYLILAVISYLTLGVSPVLTVALVFPMAGFLIRTFVVFHDCGHGSLFPSRRANHYVGVVLGLFVLNPYRHWQREHSIHHATSGDLDRRGIGDVMTLTVREYQSKPWQERLAYRLFRNPLIMFGLGPILAMFIAPRIVQKDARPRQRNSVILTDISLVIAFAVLFLTIGWQAMLVVWLPPSLLAGAGGVWLFYVQHQFEDTYWERGDEWNYAQAALQGSSYLKLPRVLQFFSANIGLHHVHHLQASIPNYNLERAHNAHPLLAQVPTMSMTDGMRAIRFKLWDERSNKLVTFAQAREVAASPAVSPEVAGAQRGAI